MGFLADVGRSGGLRRLTAQYDQGQQGLIGTALSVRQDQRQQQIVDAQTKKLQKEEEEYNRPVNIKYSLPVLQARELYGDDAPEVQNIISSLSTATGADESGMTQAGRMAEGKKILASDSAFMKTTFDMFEQKQVNELIKLQKKLDPTPEDKAKMKSINDRLSMTSAKYQSYLKAQKEDEAKAPTVKEFKVGEEIVTKEWDGTKWVESSRGPRHKPPSTTVNVGNQRADFEVVKKAIGELPAQRTEAKAAERNISRIDQMVDLLDKGAGGRLGKIKAWLAPSVEAMGINVDSLNEAQTYELMAVQLGGSMRVETIGPGPVTEYEQKLLATVNAGGSAAVGAARRLLKFYKEGAVAKIQGYNESVEGVSKISPDAANLFKTIDIGGGVQVVEDKIMGALETLWATYDKDYSDIPFEMFLQKYSKKNYPDMPFDEFSAKIGYGGGGYDPQTVKGTGGEAMEPTEAMMGGPSRVPGIENYYRDIGGTVGGIVGGVPGAAAGGAIGEAGRQFVAGEEPSGKKMLFEGGVQGAFEGGARIGSKVVGKVLAPSAKSISPEARESAEYFGKFGGEFSPAQAIEGKLIDLAEGVSEASMTGGPKFFRFRENQAKAFESVAEDLVERIGSSMGDHEIGMLFADAIEKSDKVFRTQASAFYKNVDTLTAGAGVDLRPLKEFAAEKLETAITREGIGGSAAGDQLLKKVEKLGDFISFEEASALRSGLGSEISSFEGKRDAAAGVAKKFFSLTDEAMEKSAKELGDEAHAAWRKAADFYKEGKATFQSKYMRGILGLVEDSASRRGAEAIVGQIFRPHKETAIRAVKKALKGKPHVWNELRGAYLTNTMGKATSTDGVILGKSFTKQLDNMGEKTLSEIFTKEELKDIRNVATIGRISQTRPAGGGSMLIQLTQAGAIVGLVAGQFEKASATVLIGPWALAHLMTTPRGIKWLTTGLKTPAATKDTAAIAGRLITEIIRSGGTEDIQITPGR